ncbi:hypothetical protein [Methylovulum miyakonense]|uniref:hypothetical protein n=1 Tax=Methylovulum miyakonense TaxID=645578 RepID=UPI000362E14C|nr:hypothetical protein [Methylovulum miyakonense]
MKTSKTRLVTVIQTALAVTAASVILSSPANAALDFTDVTGAIDNGTLLAAIGVLAVVKVAPGFARWGFNQVIRWFR